MKKTSKSFYLWLKQELELWKQEGIVSEEQAEKIKEKYHLAQIEEKDAATKLIMVISLIGALLIGGGVILFIASNWQVIPKSVKLLVIFGIILSVNYFGYYLRYTKGAYPKVGLALLFLGSLLFGAGIWLVAQTYNITSRYHSGVLFWSVGILPVSWLLGLQSILVLSSGLLSFWTVWKSLDISTPNYLYPVMMFSAILPLCYKQKSKIALFVSLTGILLWFGFGPCLFYLKPPQMFHLLILFYITLGVFLYSTGLLHSFYERLADYQLIYRFLGIFVLFSFIYIVSFKEIIMEMGRLATAPFPVSFWVIFGMLILLSCIAIGGVLLTRRINEYASNILNYEIAFIGILLLFPVSILILHNAVFHSILANLLLLTLSVGVIILGYYEERALFINIGFVFFGIHFFTRYFDWAYKYLPRSLFFIISGIILILIATFMEKQRRKLIQAIRKET